MTTIEAITVPHTNGTTTTPPDRSRSDRARPTSSLLPIAFAAASPVPVPAAGAARPSSLPVIDAPAGMVRVFLDRDGRRCSCAPAGRPIPDIAARLDEHVPIGTGRCWALADTGPDGGPQGIACPVTPNWRHHRWQAVAIVTEARP